MAHVDKRVRLISEIVGGIRAIRFFAYEDAYAARVSAARTDEVSQRRTANSLHAANSSLNIIGPPLVALSTFALYSFTDNTLTASKAFTSLALFDILRLPLTVIPMLVEQLTSATVAVDRLKRFFAEADVVPYVVGRGERAEESPPADLAEGGRAPVAWMKGATLAWAVGGAGSRAASAPREKEAVDQETGEEKTAREATEAAADAAADRPSLTDVSFVVPKGALATIVGSVGSGKSSILGGLLGEMRPLGKAADEGATCVGLVGTAAYCAQTPWILNASVRDNITFGKDFDKTAYKAVIHACALRPDFAVLPDGDSTMVGERGVALSGGQKARIALARAVYQDADVYLLDDVLSAVDSHVGKHIFENCFKGLLKDKTIVFSSHQVQFLSASDIVIVTDTGSVTHCCPPNALPSDIMSGLREAEVEADTAETEEVAADLDNVALDVDVDDSGEKNGDVPARDRTRSHASVSGDGEAGVTKQKDEDREEGAVRLDVYKSYFAAGGSVVSAVVITLAICAAGAQAGMDWWLSRWSDRVGGHSVGFYLEIYALWGLAQCVGIISYQLVWVFLSLRASTRLHESMLHRVLRAPLTSFFDVTPAGRIVNRFSTDLQNIDQLLPRSFSSYMQLLARVVAALVLQVAALPFVGIAFLPIVAIFVMLQQAYRPAARQLKRLDAVSMSPVIQRFGELLDGITTIRAYNAQQRFIEGQVAAQSANIQCFYSLNAVNRWLGLRLDVLGSLIVLATAVGVVAYGSSVDPGIVGLTLAYALSITSTLNWLVRSATETETFMASTERIIAFTEIPSEAPWRIAPGPAKDWPARTGDNQVVFKDVSFKYRPELPLVLKGVTFSVTAGERVGIAGRTGSGKSSLVNALFRTQEIDGGRIEIGGMDTSKLGLHDLRERLAVIPQDAALFTGTLRSNLDPHGRHTDAELHDAIKRVHLTPRLEARNEGLEMVMDEGGKSLSVGERQLVCIARALLRKAHILVMDEATAAIDMETDRLIQEVIRTGIDSTVLTIAHRLNTILDYDKIIFMDDGRVTEFGSPAELMARENGQFASMVRSHREAGGQA